MFAHAKKMAPRIVFTEEVDPRCRDRGAGLDGGHTVKPCAVPARTHYSLVVVMESIGAGSVWINLT